MFATVPHNIIVFSRISPIRRLCQWHSDKNSLPNEVNFMVPSDRQNSKQKGEEWLLLTLKCTGVSLENSNIPWIFLEPTAKLSHMLANFSECFIIKGNQRKQFCF